MRTQVLDLPARIQSLEDAAVLRLRENPVRVLIAHVGHVPETKLREADFDLPIEPSAFVAILVSLSDALWHQFALIDPWYELLIVLDVSDYAEKIFLRVRQHLARLKFYCLWFKNSVETPFWMVRPSR